MSKPESVEAASPKVYQSLTVQEPTTSRSGQKAKDVINHFNSMCSSLLSALLLLEMDLVLVAMLYYGQHVILYFWLQHRLH